MHAATGPQGGSRFEETARAMGNPNRDSGNANGGVGHWAAATFVSKLREPRNATPPSAPQGRQRKNILHPLQLIIAW